MKYQYYKNVTSISHDSMSEEYPFRYHLIIKRNGGNKMELLKVNDIKKTYTSRLGGTHVQALKGVTFIVDFHQERVR